MIKKPMLALSLILLLSLSAGIFWLSEGKPPFFSVFEKPAHYDLLIKNGNIADGSGRKLFRGDLAVNGEKIARVGRFRATAEKTIDAEGLVVSPGFINPHSHIDQIILSDPDVPASLLQGVTTEIVGVDGQSALNLEKHFSEVSAKGMGINYGSLVGQGTVRLAVMGGSDHPATAKEIASMQALVKNAMEEGAFGLSTGLEYLPGVFTPTEEIIQLAKTVSPYKGLYVSHIRDEGDNVADAVKEALEIGRRAGVPAVVSHIKVGSSINDGSRQKVLVHKTNEIVETIKDYRDSGGKVFADLYPYRVGFFLVNRRPEEVLWRFPKDIIFVSGGSHQNFLGKTISQIAASEGVQPEIIAQRLVADPNSRVSVNSMSEASLRTFLEQDFTMIAMDNVTYWPDPSYTPPAHPRNYGTFPRILGEYVRGGVLSLEEAVHKMTGLTAQVYNIPQRGFIKEGFFADLVIFDPRTIRDRATYWEPGLPPQGIFHVLVNGQPAVSKGTYALAAAQPNGLTGIRGGKIIKPRKILPGHP